MMSSEVPICQEQEAAETTLTEPWDYVALNPAALCLTAFATNGVRQTVEKLGMSRRRQTRR